MSTADAILARLAGVRQVGGSRWMARCPAHEDRSPSLSITETSEGRVLVKCWAGCQTKDVLAAVALDWRELFPPREPGASPSRRPWAARYSASDLLEIVSEEVTVVTIVAADLISKRAIAEEDWKRLAVAVGRIQKVRDQHIIRRAA